MRQNGLSVFNLVPFVASFEMVDYMPKANTCWSIYDPQKLSCSSYAYYLLVWNFRKKIKIKGPSSSFLSWGINYTCFCGITFLFFFFSFFDLEFDLQFWSIIPKYDKFEKYLRGQLPARYFGCQLRGYIYKYGWYLFRFTFFFNFG